MSLAWFGNPDWDDDRPPCRPVPVCCKKCHTQMTWWKPLTYDGPPPKCDCGGKVEQTTSTQA